MADNDEFRDLLRQYYERAIHELEQSIQSALSDPGGSMEALRAALADEEPAEEAGNPLLEDVDPNLIRADEETLTLPDGQVVTRSQVQDFLSKYQGTIADGRSEDGPIIEGVRLSREQASEHLTRIDAELREAVEADKAQKRAAWSAEWAANNTNGA